MIRIFKSKGFTKFAKKNTISDNALVGLIKDIEAGKCDADYGGGVIKQRLAREGEGKSGGYRTIILYRQKDKAFFVYGFAKQDQDNISKDDEKNFKKAAKEILNFTDNQLTELTQKGIFEEVRKNVKKI